MKRNVLNFFKSSACAKSFFVFGAAFLAILSISCKQLASFDPVVNGEQVVVGGGGNSGGGDTSSLEAAEFSFNLKATHGLMRKISLEWTAFSGAKYYEIYFAESAAAEFTKIGETEQPFFDDAVAAGRTGYFKVCAVKANGSSTPFSSTVVGTSLAVPIISGGDVNDSSASISWFMENARGIDGTDYYEKSLKFEVVCQPKGESEGGETKVLSASSFSSTSYSYTFEELSSSKDYEFYVAAYLESDTQSRETSPTVDKTTLTTYTPLSPKFSASEGDSAKGISLLITLPEMVTVKTFVKESENPNIMQDVPYPLCFRILRKHEKEEAYSEKNAVTLYYDGTNLTTNPVEYQEAGAPYEVGAQVKWVDGDASLIGGEKYDYMIRSFVDANYSKVVCVEGKEYNTPTGTPLDKANTSQGWKSAPPVFNVKVAEDGGRKLSDDRSKVVSVSFGFSAEWNDLGKAGDYKFAIRQTYAPFTDESGTSAWLKNGGTIYFDTLDGIKALVKTFGSDSGLPKNEQGTYSYTLYVVSKNDNGTSDIESNDNVLDSTNARDRMVVTEDVNLPKAELAVQGGYKNKVHYKFTCEQGVRYQLERTKVVDGKPTDGITIELNNTPASGTFEGDDTTVQDNCSYSYVLKAVAASGVPALSTAQEAETLGTPKVSFKIDEKTGLSYDSVAVSFDGVLAAKEYIVTLGASGDFGGGIPYTFAAGGDSSSGNAKVEFTANKYTVTIEKPEGYNDARFAGNFVDAVVTAKSGVDNASGETKVNVLGPALLNAQVNVADTTGESISLTWNKVDGAKGYLIRRVMYGDAAMNKIAESSGITYYYDALNGKITLAGDDDIGGRATVSASENGFTLTDTYKEMDTNADPAVQEYQEAQAKLAWGLPFQYVVLPVSKATDFDFNDLKLADGGEVAYKNLSPTKGAATWGYGLNLVAEKATSGNTQGAKWEKPHVDKAGETDYAATKPVVYRRVAGEPGEFEQFRDSSDEVSSEKATMDIKPSNKADIGAYEYLVKYYKNGASTDEKISPPESLLAEIAKRTTQYETPVGTMTEQDNKGYLLTIGNFSAGIATENYYEKISWNRWNYNTRAVGPDSMVIFIQNNNIGADPKEVVEIVEANSEKTINYVGKDIDGASLGPASVRIAPASIVAGTKSTTDGYLKVLRDYKHNYTFKLKRKISTDEGDVDISVPNKDYETSYVKTAYRQITNEELVRAATLAMTIGIEKTGTDWKTYNTSGTTDSHQQGNGNVSVTKKGGDTTGSSLEMTFSFTKYSTVMPAKTKDSVSFLTLDGTVIGYTYTGGSLGQRRYPKEYNGKLQVYFPSEYKTTDPVDITFFWLGCESEPREPNTSDTANKTRKRGIEIIQQGSEMELFGNITPLPFGNGIKTPVWNYKDINGPLNNSEEWQ